MACLTGLTGSSNEPGTGCTDLCPIPLYIDVDVFYIDDGNIARIKVVKSM